MILIRKAKERGLTQTDWLKSYHTFSFGEYYDPEHQGFGNLRVINEDRVQPGKGFGSHRHHDMEIISLVISGALEHKDSMGTGSLIRPGEIQRMSAGTGVMHSEFNPSDSEVVHFLQIWIMPIRNELPPSYEQKTLPKKTNQLMLIGSLQGSDEIITIHQNLNLYFAKFDKVHTIKQELTQSRGWFQAIKGQIEVNGKQLEAGDGAGIIEEKNIEVNAVEGAEFLLFDFS